MQRGEPVPSALEKAMFHGTSIGGARPEALIQDDPDKFIAKFSAANDAMAVVKAEFVAMRLAAEVGLEVAQVRMAKASGKDVLLLRRLDREWTGTGWTRRAMVSALTMLGLGEMQARYASYVDLAELVRAPHGPKGHAPRAVRPHGLQRVGRQHRRPCPQPRRVLGRRQAHKAYDLCPQPRSGREANQAMLMNGEDKRSRIETCRLTAPNFRLSDRIARDLIDEQVATITRRWTTACDEAELSEIDRASLWRRQFLNDYAFEGYAGGALRPKRAISRPNRRAPRPRSR